MHRAKQQQKKIVVVIVVTQGNQKLKKIVRQKKISLCVFISFLVSNLYTEV